MCMDSRNHSWHFQRLKSTRHQYEIYTCVRRFSIPQAADLCLSIYFGGQIDSEIELWRTHMQYMMWRLLLANSVRCITLGQSMIKQWMIRERCYKGFYDAFILVQIIYHVMAIDRVNAPWSAVLSDQLWGIKTCLDSSQYSIFIHNPIHQLHHQLISIRIREPAVFSDRLNHEVHSHATCLAACCTWSVTPTATRLILTESGSAAPATPVGDTLEVRQKPDRPPNQCLANNQETRKIDDGFSRNDIFHKQVTSNIQCASANACSVSDLTSYTVGYSVSATFTPFSWINGGFSVSESYTTGNSYT